MSCNLWMSLPIELTRNIFSYDGTHRDDYRKVMHELELQYNSGLWWLYSVKLPAYLDNESIRPVEFTDCDEEDDICQLAMYHLTLNEELADSTFEIYS